MNIKKYTKCLFGNHEIQYIDRLCFNSVCVNCGKKIENSISPRGIVDEISMYFIRNGKYPKHIYMPIKLFHNFYDLMYNIELEKEEGVPFIYFMEIKVSPKKGMKKLIEFE